MNLKFIILLFLLLGSASNNSFDGKMDYAGFAVAGIGMELLVTVVFALVMLWLYHTFFIKPRLNSKKPEAKITSDSKKTVDNRNDASDVSDEISAVIGLAIHLYKQQLSDYEKARLTIARVSRTYSPWSSKIYGLRQNPRR